ncbi:transcriptional regulator family: bZIP [Paecilomyces variotii]|nr:transcriptional regulator family: bZIP [Paecilomyces variotii]KAJ9199419.1 transcriptional regulator family: bZIP [Paecilomyces variotii]KAJ9209270.1 transcriptional regulator family: bZIP [Paecilomyces variotii]KAJ9224101.1 transcriptional regulator family: bZIP [Paecilomyces variotii]KAJ9235219.1 transcriptional regulator family: bZIP [Paecilomyces variotii]
MQSSAQDHADQVLHDQLLAAQQHLSSHPQQARPQQSPTHPQHLQPGAPGSRDQNNIDPAIAGTAMLNPPPEQQQPPQEGSPPDGRKVYGKRELSTSKRAAQNRAAQRAFRQRKEGYIRKLEEQVKEYEALTESYKAIQAENYQLREYIISLQSRLIDSQNEVPELPGNIDLSQPRPEPPVAATASAPGAGPSSSVPGPAPPQQQGQPSTAGTATGEDLSSLNRIAVAGLGMRKHPHEEAAYLTNNFPAQKRMRSEDGQPEQQTTKTEPSHGLPVAT